MRDMGNLSVVYGNTSHITDRTDGIDNHVLILVIHIGSFYLNIGIRHFHIAKIWNVNRKDAAVRQQLTKLVLFKNQ